MAPTEIREALDAIPFEPFRLVVSSVNNYEIDDPRSVLVANRYVHIGIRAVPGDRIPDRIIRVDLLRITELVPLHGPSPQQGGNGQPGS